MEYFNQKVIQICFCWHWFYRTSFFFLNTPILFFYSLLPLQMLQQEILPPIWRNVKFCEVPFPFILQLKNFWFLGTTQDYWKMRLKSLRQEWLKATEKISKEHREAFKWKQMDPSKLQREANRSPRNTAREQTFRKCSKTSLLSFPSFSALCAVFLAKFTDFFIPWTSLIKVSQFCFFDPQIKLVNILNCPPKHGIPYAVLSNGLQLGSLAYSVSLGNALFLLKMRKRIYNHNDK